MYDFQRIFRGGLVAAALAVCAAALAAAPAGPNARKYDAREVAAWADMTALRDAEIAAYIDTDYLHTLENLNDLFDSNPVYYFDDIDYGGGARVLSIITGRFLTNRIDYRFSLRPWLGPYATFQQNHFSIDGAGYDPGTPLDPWDNPYYLFSPLGLADPQTGLLTLDLYGDMFDRWAIVSLGSDGVMSDDDLILLFEGGVFGPPSVVAISSLRPATASPGKQVTVRGYNFGAVQGDARLELAGQPVTPISWSDRAIVFAVPQNSSGGDVVVVRGTARSNAFPLRVVVGVRRWAMYK